MLGTISELPLGVIIFIILLTIGLIISIIKKAIKFAIWVISILLILFILYNLATNYFQIFP